MKRLLILLLLCTASVSAQTTVVTGTITDPQGNPYQNGTASAQKVVSSGQNPGPPFNTTTNAAGLFSFSGLLALPSPASYIFTICAAPSNIGPKANPTPVQQCFANTVPIAISGASQDVSATLNALAPALGPSLSNIQGANNNFTGNNSFVNLTVSGNIAATGTQNLASVTNLNGIPVVNTTNFTSVQAALNSLGSVPGIVFVPPGTWAPAAANTSLTLTNSFQRVICAGMDSTVIQYSGTTNITAVVDVGTADNGTAQQVNDAVTNCTISGNAHTTYAMRVRGTHRSDFSHNKLINAVTAGLFSDFAVADTWDDLHTSSQEQAFTTTPASCFIFDGPDTNHRTTASLVKNPICEGVSGTGIVINNASSITIKGGTSEQNGKGITLGVGSLSNIIDGVDTEANTTSNIEDGGQQNAFRNLVGNGTYKVVAGANSSYWLGLVYDTFSNAGNFTYLDYFAFNNSGTGTFTDTGTNSVRHWVQKLSVGQQFGDEYGTCVFAASTTCAVTFSPTWINAPLVFIQPINPGAVTFTITVGPSTTGFTITASASNSLTVDWSASLH